MTSAWKTTYDTDETCPECGDYLLYVEQDEAWPPDVDYPLEYYRCTECNSDWDIWLDEKLN